MFTQARIRPPNNWESTEIKLSEVRTFDYDIMLPWRFFNDKLSIAFYIYDIKFSKTSKRSSCYSLKIENLKKLTGYHKNFDRSM